MDLPYFFRQAPSVQAEAGAYLVEASGDVSPAQAAEHARDAARAARAEGIRVRHVGSFVVGERCFHLFEASSAEAVARAAQLAGLDAARVVEAVA